MNLVSESRDLVSRAFGRLAGRRSRETSSVPDQIAAGKIAFRGFAGDLVHEWAGKTDIRTGCPGIETLIDAIAIPNLQALYDAAGRRIDSTNRVLVPEVPGLLPDLRAAIVEKEFRFSPPIIDVPDEPDLVDEDVFYAGPLIPHYGHFITDCMARLWALDEVPRSVPVVFLLTAKRADYGTIAALPFIRTILDTLGIGPERLSIVDRPTRFKRVIAPRPAMEQAYRINTWHDRPHRRITEALASKARSGSTRPVYLSRAGLPSGRSAGPGERDLEAFLAHKGFDIVRPETLPLDSQIELFNTRRAIVALIGSALHTSLFSLPGYQGHIVGLGWESVSPKFLIIDAIKTYRSTYMKVMASDMSSGRERITSFDLERAKALLSDELGL